MERRMIALRVRNPAARHEEALNSVKPTVTRSQSRPHRHSDIDGQIEPKEEADGARAVFPRMAPLGRNSRSDAMATQFSFRAVNL
jgi:hypothetical protein